MAKQGGRDLDGPPSVFWAHGDFWYALLMIALLLLLLFQSVEPQPNQIPGARPYVCKTTPQGELRLHVFSPDNAREKTPAIVFFFGGGWRRGSVTAFMPHAKRLASRGMVAILADYRVLGRHKTTPAESVADAKSVIRWVREHAEDLGVDPTRVVASGSSAGGHLAAATALVPGFEDETRGDPTPNALVLVSPGVHIPDKWFGDLSAKISPAKFVREGAPPTIIFHGSADALVPESTVVDFCKDMKAVGNKCTVVVFEGAGHGLQSVYQELMQKIDEFLVRLGYLPTQNP